MKFLFLKKKCYLKYNFIKVKYFQKNFFLKVSLKSQFKSVIFKKLISHSLIISKISSHNYYTIFSKSDCFFLISFFKKHQDSLFLGFFAKFRVLGLGFKFWILKHYIVFDVGRTHRKFINMTALLTTVRKKLSFLVYSFSKHLLSMFCILVLNIRRISPYKPKGLLPMDREIKKKKMSIENRV